MQLQRVVHNYLSRTKKYIQQCGPHSFKTLSNILIIVIILKRSFDVILCMYTYVFFIFFFLLKFQLVNLSRNAI